MKSFRNSILKGFFFVVLLILNFNVFAQLEEGTWFKISIKESGVYKLDAAFFKKHKIKISEINPQNIRLFGAGAGMLPQKNSDVRNGNLQEMAIMIEGEADNKFDDTDLILFYAESADYVGFNENNLLSHQKNIYSDSAFYFLNFGKIKGKRIKNVAITNAENELKTFQDYQYREADLKNMVGSGREWVGEYFGGTPNQRFKINMPGIVPNSEMTISSETMVATSSTANFALKINDQDAINHYFDPVGSGRFDIKGRLDFQSKKVIANGKDSISFQYIFNAEANQSGLRLSEGYLNFFALQSERNFDDYKSQTTAFLQDLTPFNNYGITFKTASKDLKVWNISDLYTAYNQEINVDKSFLEANESNAKLQLFNLQNVLIPSAIIGISNQKIKSYPTPVLLIVSAPNFVVQAEKLATYRKQKDGMDAIVVTTNEIYNEFSDGKQDPTAIRDYVKFLYDKDPQKFKYLLLFGDANFDYRNIYQSQGFDQDSFIPVYESRESFHPVKSFSSDDYYGFLEKNEGDWAENYEGNHTLEIGIGRLPVKNSQDAEQIVEKIIHYETSKNVFGTWRTQVSFLADDGDNNIHQLDAEQLSGLLLQQNSQFSLNKIYLDAFPQLASTSGAKAPEVNAEIKRSGLKSLVMNYNGHGGTSGFAEEQIINTQDIDSWQNKNTLPILFTATCDFGRFDSPIAVSGAELALLNPKGGAIGLLSTTRPVYSSTNFTINKAFYEILRKTKSGERLGDLHRQTKNLGIDDIYNRNFSLLGDPAMKLALPDAIVTFNKINGKAIGKDTLRALQNIKIEGAVLQDDFNGLMQVKIYDKPQQKNTFGTESPKMQFNSFQKKIFEGIVSVKNSKFQINFIVPKDIDYRFGKGRIECYAVNTDSTQDVAGIYNDVMIGGSEKVILADNIPPKIELSSSKDLIFKANVFDESGINISNEIGHEMWLIVDDSIKIKALNYYKPILDDFKKGILEFPIGHLKKGEHTIQLKIWDTQNNSSEETLKLQIKTENIRLETAASPNPFQGAVEIKVTNLLVGEDLEATFLISDGAGRILYETTKNIPKSEAFLYFNWIAESSLRTEKCYYNVRLKSKSQTKIGSGTLIFWK